MLPFLLAFTLSCPSSVMFLGPWRGRQCKCGYCLLCLTEPWVLRHTIDICSQKLAGKSAVAKGTFPTIGEAESSSLEVSTFGSQFERHTLFNEQWQLSIVACDLLHYECLSWAAALFPVPPWDVGLIQIDFAAAVKPHLSRTLALLSRIPQTKLGKVLLIL